MVAFSDFSDNLSEALSDRRRQLLYEKVIEALSKPDLDVKYQLLQLCVDVLAGQGSELELSTPNLVRPLLSELLDSSDKEYERTAKIFLMQLSDRE